MGKILIVEDEKPIANLIRMSLSKEHHVCHNVYDGVQACDLIENENFDLILLDIMLPNLDGFDIMNYAKLVDIPVIFLTAMNSTDYKVKGLKMGAEDYITKPFQVTELIARVDNVLKRHMSTMNQIHDIKIDFEKRVVFQSQKIIELTELEFDLLVYMMTYVNKVLMREQIYEHVWKKTFNVESRTVDMSIRRLKKKLNWNNEIVSIYKAGYRLIND